MTALIVTIFAVAAVLAFALGAAGGYFFYRSRHREALSEMESLDHELAEREAELRRLKYQISTARVSTLPDDENYAAMQREITALREELEQRDLDLNILRQDYDLETRILKQEIAQLNEAEQDGTKREQQALQKERADIDRLRAQLQQQQQQLQKRREEVEHERMQLTRQEEAAEERRTGLERRARELDERDHRIEEREAHLREREARVDEREAAAPQPTATAADASHNALLVKRLRQQIRLQEEELQQLRAHLAQQPTARPRPDSSAQAIPGPPEATGSSFPAFSPLSALMGTGRAPAGAERRPGRLDPLSAITGVDGDVQSRLYAMGVTTFEQIARWSSADVRRVAEQLGIDRETIQNRWILEAQSHLYEQTH